MRNKTKRFTALFLATLMIVTGMFGNISVPSRAEEAAVVISEFNFSTSSALDFEGFAQATAGTGKIGNDLTMSFSSNGLTASNWKEGDAWVISGIDASDYTAVTFSAKMRSTKTGPGNFKLQYLYEGEWKDISEEVHPTDKLTAVFSDIPVPAEALSSDLTLRLVNTSGLTASGSAIGSTGNNNLNAVSLKGVYNGTEELLASVSAKGKTTVLKGTAVELTCATGGVDIYYSFDKDTGYVLYEGGIAINDAATVYAFSQKGSSQSPVTSISYTIEKCGGVTANPGSKSEVNVGDTITLSTKTEGATIMYRFGSSGDYSVYTGPITVTEDLTKIQAYATCPEKYADGSMTGFNYTVLAPVVPDVPVSPVLEEVKDGDSFYLYAINYGSVLTSTVSGKKLAAAEAGISEDGSLYVEKTEENAALVDSVVKLTASADDNGYFSFTAKNAEGKDLYLTSPATGNGLSLAAEASEYSLWKVESNDNGMLIGNINASYTKNGVVYEEYVEYYNGFTTYNYPASDTKAYEFALYRDITVKEGEVIPPKPPVDEKVTASKLNREFFDGDEVVIFFANSGSPFVMGEAAKGAKLSAIESAGGDTIEVPEGAAVLKVKIEEEGVYSFISKDGKYLTSAPTGNGLSLADAASDYSLWNIERNDNGVYVINVNAKYGTNNEYLEYYSGFTTYTYKSASDSVYLFDFYLVKEGTQVLLFDKSVENVIASWSGSGNYGEAGVTVSVNGDAFTSGDLLDSDSVYTAVVSGKEVKPFTTGTSSTTGITTYYMGATGVGSGTDDYLQLLLSSKGYGNLSMSFRLRVSNTGAGSFALKYSTDGVNFEDFKTGTYAYSYTSYSSDGTSTPVSRDGVISDGTARTSMSPASYISFTFDVPAGAQNADKLYIRLVPGKEQAKDSSKTPSSGGTVRFDTVEIKGNPVVDDSVCGFVTAEPVSGEVSMGTEIALSTKTEGALIYYSFDGTEYFVYNPESRPVLTSFPCRLVTYAAKEGKKDSVKMIYSYTQAQVSTVKGTPNGGAVTAGQRLVLKCATEGAAIMYAFDNADGAEPEWLDYEDPISLMTFPVTIKVKAVKEGLLDSEIKTLTFTQKANAKYNIYFGQIHSHTNFSDGAGDCEEAFAYASKVDNLDFLAVTDHSNSLDGAGGKNSITNNTDTSEENEWTKGHALAKKYSSDDFTGLYGYEMTWSNGLGHMNTFNTAGFQDRSQADYANYSTALQNYYAALNTDPDSISMFNHPGTTFGDFQDFSYYSESNDDLITLIEVGNGEGVIGSSGYFPSYEYYTRALDKGWHVAPANNQDNHKGKWGDANTGRTVVLADANNEENIYDAMRNYRVYATEDNDLNIYYTLDNYIMGTILDEDAVGDNVNIKAEISDATDAIGKIEVIVNGGLSIYSETTALQDKVFEITVPANYSYYYLKITEADGDIAVTAPVWVGNVESCGINSVYTNVVLPVAGESMDINVDLYNNEKSTLEIEGITVTVTDAEGIVTEIANLSAAEIGFSEVLSKETASFRLDYVYDSAGKVIYEVTVHGKLKDAEKTYSDKLTASYVTPGMVTNVLIDGTHFNDYVEGYYGGNMTNFISICADRNIKATVVTDEITKEMLDDCALLVVSAPASKSGTANAGDYVPSAFEEDFVNLVKNYVEGGGSVIFCGIADYSNYKAAAEINKLLSAVNSTLSLNSDEVCDDVTNGGQVYRMYPSNFNMASDVFEGTITKEMNPDNYQTYSQYSGCSVSVAEGANDYVNEAEWLVKGFETTYSMDCKDETGSNIGNIHNDNMGDVIFLAHQSTKAGGDIYAAGGVFISDFETDFDKDNNDSLPYANYNIICNILDDVTVELPVSTIAEARKGNTGDVFVVEGYVTSGTDNGFTTFFDTIYIQDDTAGIDIFPYSEAGLAIGTKVKITGFVSSYQGDIELKVISSEIISDAEPHVYKAKELSTAEAMDYASYGGSLLKTTGKVTRVKVENGVVSEFWLADESGKEAAIFVDGYIYSGTTGENNLADFVEEKATVSASGILYMHPEDDSEESVPVFRVRNCDDIVLIEAPKPDEPDTPDEPDEPDEPDTPDEPDEPVKPVVNPVVQIVTAVANVVTTVVKTVVKTVVSAVSNIVKGIFGKIFCR